MSGTPAKAADPPFFAGRLAEARLPLQVDADGVHGAGATVLSSAVASARYVLIGEDHLSREIPRFTTAICRLMAPSGLDAFAVEIGPEAARVVNDDLRAPDRRARIAAFMRAHPDAFAFQNGEDESDMAATCAALAGPRFRIWGLDQEFFGATGTLLDRMAISRPGPSARAAIGKLQALDRAATAAALASGSPGDLLLYTITDAQLAEARAAIAQDGSKRAKDLSDALAETREIYLGQRSDGYASNGQRARLMKRTLVRYMASRPQPARILFKFGDAHMAKGVNTLGQRDLGNFVAERAEGEGATSLHIAVYGARGVHALYNGVGRQVRNEPFVLTDDEDYAFLKDVLPPRDKAETDWTLVDLRPLRVHTPSGTPPAWKRMIDRYDLIVIAPELTPSTVLGARP